MRKYKRQADGSYKYTLANVNLREENSASSKVLTVIPSGSKVQVVDAAEDWYEVVYNNQRGYVYSSYLSTTKYTWRDTFLRSYPAAESNPISVVPTKSEVQVLSVVGDWSEVVYNDRKGYIFTYFCAIF